jgi:hypothetical protein
MACAAENTDKTRTAAFYLAPALARCAHGQFTDSAEKLLSSREVSSTQGIPIHMTVGRMRWSTRAADTDHF